MARGRYRFRRRPEGSWRIFATVIALVALVLAAAWTVGLVRYVDRIPTGVEAPAEAADAIVVLTGGSRRVEAGVALLVAGAAPVLFVSGVDHRVDPTRIRELLPEVGALDPAIIDCCIVLGYDAPDTFGNARETALWMRATGRRSLILVTSNYHLPRARLEFEHAFPEAILHSYPVVPPDVRMTAWWRWPGTFGLISSEWSKFVFARARVALANLILPAASADSKTNREQN
jgi:uncharacterized SAM-binding protein YcdF (DUF218 family)